ncbi:lipocalin-like domain-containing protein [Streptomyces sp. NPDC059697]|uniref:lipocalin-like domain-containing protein n=1 Tax=Streptomyces sp. NPDC059697 TaxID=3346912 RepID=UPI0036B72EE9
MAQRVFLVQRLAAGTDIAQFDVVVANVSTGTSRAAQYIHFFDRAEIGTDRLRMGIPELTWTGDRNGYTLSVKGEGARIDLIATASGPPLPANGQGQMLFLGLDEPYEFAFPAMRTSGTVALGSQPYEVTGISWSDRQWGSLPDFFADSLGQSPEAVLSSPHPPVSPMN